jgi:hypothetical protein
MASLGKLACERGHGTWRIWKRNAETGAVEVRQCERCGTLRHI